MAPPFAGSTEKTSEQIFIVSLDSYMDVQRLRVLRELADRGSVTAVAAALAYTPSAISQQLKALTQEVGLVLTEPAGRGVRLTDAGHALVAEAEQVLAALSRAERRSRGCAPNRPARSGWRSSSPVPGCCCPACCGGSTA